MTKTKWAPMAIVQWGDGRPPTTVYLTGLYKTSDFTGKERVFWDYRDKNQKMIGPGPSPSKEWAWEALKFWATDQGGKAIAYKVPEDRAEPEFDDKDNPAILTKKDLI